MTDSANPVNPEMTADETPRPPSRDEYLAQVEAAQRTADELQASITQREWLLIRRALDSSRLEVIQDGGLRMVALAWVKASRAHGGATWDQFLNMTDDEALEANGFPTVLPYDMVEGLDLADPSSGMVTVTEEEARAKANFCLRLNIAPSEYDGLTDFEREAFREEARLILQEAKDAQEGRS